MKLGGGALMAIGYGQGENKADKAIDQALHHPMIESVSLDHAAGVIANFTGGPDMTLFEVEAALTRLSEQTTPQTEIVLGIINDDDKYRGMFDFSCWYHELLIKEGHR